MKIRRRLASLAGPWVAITVSHPAGSSFCKAASLTWKSSWKRNSALFSTNVSAAADCTAPLTAPAASNAPPAPNAIILPMTSLPCCIGRLADGQALTARHYHEVRALLASAFFDEAELTDVVAGRTGQFSLLRSAVTRWPDRSRDQAGSAMTHGGMSVIANAVAVCPVDRLSQSE